MMGFIFFGMESEFGLHLSLVLIPLPLLLRWWWDYDTIVVQQREPLHGNRLIITVLAMMATSYLVWRWGPARYYIQPVVLSFCLFAALFGYGLSLLRGKSWWYIDEGLDGKQSWTDSIYVQLGVWKVLLLNIWFILLGVSVYFFMNYVV